jgi:hypothetical protein
VLGYFISSDSTMNIDLHSPRLVSPKTALAVVFAISGAYVLNQSGLLGISGLALAVCCGFLCKGIGLDVAGKRYRFYISLLQLRIGDWQPLPTIRGVTLKYFSERVTSGKPGRMRADKVDYYVLLLSVQNSQQGIIVKEYDLDERQEALQLAALLAQILKVEFFDYSG